MKRSGFARKTYVPAAAAPLRALTRAGVVARISGNVVALPKTCRRENRHLLDMARNMPCLFQIKDVCNGDWQTTVAAHSNWAEHGGKGGARKADDCYSAWACCDCHHWLDFGPTDGEVKKLAFLQAHLRQVTRWRVIATDPAEPEKDRAAALWALNQLNATPVGQVI